MTNEPLVARIKATSLTWQRSMDDPDLFYGSAEGVNLALRINDFPEEVMFTLLVDGRVLDEFNNRPAGWTIPPRPR